MTTSKTVSGGTMTLAAENEETELCPRGTMAAAKAVCESRCFREDISREQVELIAALRELLTAADKKA